MKLRKLNSKYLRTLVQTEVLKDSIPLPGLSRLTRQQVHETSFSSKIFWSCIFTGCFIGLGYQTYDRVAFYLQYPTAVDVHFLVATPMIFPPLMICGFFGSPAIIAEWRKAEIPKDDFGLDWNCVNPFLNLMGISNLSIDHLYFAASIANITTDIRVKKSRHASLFGLPLDISIDHLNTPYGVCKTLKLNGKETQIVAGSKVTVKLDTHAKDICAVEAVYFITLVPNIKIPTLAFGVTQLLMSRITMRFDKTKYSFFDSPRSSCVSENEFENCIYECLLSKMNENLTCRFPFTPPEIKKPSCNDPKEARKAYAQILQIHANIHPTADCNCTKSCADYSYVLNAEASLIDGHTTTADPCDPSSVDPCYTEQELIFTGSEHTELTERSLYNVGTLIADFGGNLGLFLGLSILSTVQILHIMWNLQQKRLNYLAASKRFQRVNPILFQRLDKKKKSTNLMRSVTFIMFVTIIFALYNRFFMYWHQPIIMTVKVERADYVLYPDITLCGEDPDLIDIRDSLAEITNGRSCYVSPWELIGYTVDDKVLTTNKIWNLLSLEDSFFTGVDTFEYYSGLPNFIRFNKEKQILPHGKCTRFTAPGPYKFQGAWGQASVVLQPILMPENCYPKSVMVFASPWRDPIDLLAANDMPLFMYSGLWFLEKRVQRLNTKSQPCVEKKTYLSCQTTCFTKKVSEMLSTQSCRLPFLENATLPLCNSSLDASLMFKKFLQIYKLSLSLNGGCDCIRRCSEIYYISRVFTPPLRTSGSVFNFLYQSNLIENYFEENAYPFSLCLSHMGSLLGLTLGFGLLSIVNSVVAMITSLKNRLNSK